MNIRTAGADEGARWVSEGWRLFLRNPGMWIAITIVYLLISMIAYYVPWRLGTLIFMLISPALYAGLCHGARELDEGRELAPEHLFIGLTDPRKRDPLLVLGLWQIGLNIAAAVVLAFVILFMGGGAVMGAMMGGHAAHPVVAFTGAGLAALLAGLCLFALIAMALLYASPLVMFDGVAPVEALKASFDACMKNIASMLVFGLIITVLTVIAVIPFGLGLLVLGPVLIGAIYASYKSIFSSAAKAGAPPAP